MKHKHEEKKKSMMPTVLGVVIVLLAVGFGVSMFGNDSSGNTQTPTTQSASLDAAPVFSKTTTSGKSFSIEKNIQENKPTVVYFMASTCTKCAKNWDALNAVYPEYEDKIEFVSISVDPTDSDAVLANLAQEKGFVFDTIAGDANLAAEYEVFKQTAKIGIDRNGNIVERHDGVFTQEEWKAFFDSLL